jgi:hypothetical protein
LSGCGSTLRKTIKKDEREAEVKSLIYSLLVSGFADPRSSPGYTTQVLYGIIEEHIKDDDE